MDDQKWTHRVEYPLGFAPDRTEKGIDVDVEDGENFVNGVGL